MGLSIACDFPFLFNVSWRPGALSIQHPMMCQAFQRNSNGVFTGRSGIGNWTHHFSAPIQWCEKILGNSHQASGFQHTSLSSQTAAVARITLVRYSSAGGSMLHQSRSKTCISISDFLPYVQNCCGAAPMISCLLEYWFLTRSGCSPTCRFGCGYFVASFSDLPTLARV